jgi:hypothetical protein
MDNLQIQIENLLKDWHEAGRKLFEKQCSALNYDNYSPKQALYKNKYIYLNENHAGCFMIDKNTLEIWRIKGYGVPHFGKFVGKLGMVTGKELHSLRSW